MDKKYMMRLLEEHEQKSVAVEAPLNRAERRELERLRLKAKKKKWNLNK